MKYQPVRCPQCNKKYAEHIIGRGWFWCRQCKIEFMIDRRKPVDTLTVPV